ncbi:hypothetical protein H4Q26_011858 [Puccinia striiformis f. sp. tritici PST-130]|nr:hypothetical protein H4Q26_011858 [Puccinia striiformis f. sp. tritici PST-130]
MESYACFHELTRGEATDIDLECAWLRGCRVFLRQAVFDVDYELGYVALKLDLLQHPSIFRKDHGHGL